MAKLCDPNKKAEWFITSLHGDNEQRVFADQLGIATAHQQDENKLERNGKVREAVEQFHYSQQEVARHTGPHYTIISRIMKETLNLKT